MLFALQEDTKTPSRFTFRTELSSCQVLVFTYGPSCGIMMTNYLIGLGSNLLIGLGSNLLIGLGSNLLIGLGSNLLIGLGSNLLIGLRINLLIVIN